MKAIPGRSSGFLVMISYILGTYLYGEPYSTSSNTVVYPGYTGRYTMVLLVSLVVYYSLWIGVQLPQGRYVSYSRGYILVSLGCNIGYTPVPLIPTDTDLPLLDTYCSYCTTTSNYSSILVPYYGTVFPRGWWFNSRKGRLLQYSGSMVVVVL